MNILFVYSLESGLLKNGLLDMQERMQFGISYISSLLRKHGHVTDLTIVNRLWGNKNLINLRNAILEFKPELICFTAVASEFETIANIAEGIKAEFPNLYLLIGGVHATLNPEQALACSFDAVCIGEGEYPVLELVDQLEGKTAPTGILNLWIKHGSMVERNPPREYIQNLDTLPFPDRKMWQKWMSQKIPPRCSILLSRGCPMSCSYCCNHALRKIASGTYVRTRSPENIIKEIKEILVEFPSIKEIYLETETLLVETNWCLALALSLEDLNATMRTPLSFGANIRVSPNMDLETVFAALKRCNFRFVNIGLESGSERVRREILRRNYTNEDIVEAVKLARKHGLKVCIFNLIGIPGETWNDFKETVNVNRLCKPDWHATSIFFPYPGTDLYKISLEQGLLVDGIDTRSERRKATLNLPGFPKKKIQQAYDYFDFYVYKGIDPDDRISLLFNAFKKKLYRFIHNILLILLNHLHGSSGSAEGAEKSDEFLRPL